MRSRLQQVHVLHVVLLQVLDVRVDTSRQVDYFDTINLCVPLFRDFTETFGKAFQNTLVILKQGKLDRVGLHVIHNNVRVLEQTTTSNQLLESGLESFPIKRGV